MAYTRLTNLEVAGMLKLKTGGIAKTTQADATYTASEAPSAAEYQAAVTLLNDLKAKYNALVDALQGN